MRSSILIRYRFTNEGLPYSIEIIALPRFALLKALSIITQRSSRTSETEYIMLKAAGAYEVRKQSVNIYNITKFSLL